MIKYLICGGLNHKTIFIEFGVDVLKCRNCGHIFSSYERVEDYGGYYGEEIKNFLQKIVPEYKFKYKGVEERWGAGDASCLGNGIDKKCLDDKI